MERTLNEALSGQARSTRNFRLAASTPARFRRWLGVNASDSRRCRRLLSSLRSGWELAC